MLLEVNNLSVAYGQTAAVQGVSFSLDVGNIAALIGPNGAGKSTVLKAISGTIGDYCGRRTAGDILLNGESVADLRTDQLVAKGLAMVPDGRRLFKRMTVQENIEMGAFTVKNRDIAALNYERVLSLFPALGPLRPKKAGSLSGGEQQMLAIGRALMSSPKLLLIDEPSLGLAPRLLDDVFGKLTQLRNQQDIGIVIVEQNVREAFKIADRVIGLRRGEVIKSVRPSDFADEDLHELFLG
ncbi:MAG: ABC transporter ATP-binding protein [Phycisphaerae bacterium]|jgi:branched-chain amino acid transport system ATP-binding protein